jgi:hypothetical protein
MTGKFDHDTSPDEITGDIEELRKKVDLAHDALNQIASLGCCGGARPGVGFQRAITIAADTMDRLVPYKREKAHDPA